jgi:hypothetical protein
MISKFTYAKFNENISVNWKTEMQLNNAKWLISIKTSI